MKRLVGSFRDELGEELVAGDDSQDTFDHKVNVLSWDGGVNWQEDDVSE